MVDIRNSSVLPHNHDLAEVIIADQTRGHSKIPHEDLSICHLQALTLWWRMGLTRVFWADRSMFLQETLHVLFWLYEDLRGSRTTGVIANSMSKDFLKGSLSFRSNVLTAGSL